VDLAAGRGDAADAGQAVGARAETTTPTDAVEPAPSVKRSPLVVHEAAPLFRKISAFSSSV
jgi:hypothetical protein